MNGNRSPRRLMMEMRLLARGSIALFITDPPDSEFQRGYLQSLLNVAKEWLREDMSKWPYPEADGILHNKAKQRERPSRLRVRRHR